jgi:hypothetical protein
MRLAVACLALAALAVPAAAQDRNQMNASSFNNMSAQDAARLNHAAQNDPKARQGLDQIEKGLKDSGHRSGQMLERTRP